MDRTPTPEHQPGMDTPALEYPSDEEVTELLGLYRDNGWSYLPLEARGKRPCEPWTKYQATRPTESETAQWRQRYPGCNWGLITGRLSGITVLDCDSEAAIQLAYSLGLPPTPMVKTARGAHYYFQYAPGSRNFSKRDDLPGIDLRSEGGYVVAPPSIHPTGLPYAWLSTDETLAVLPAWVCADPQQPAQREPVEALYCPLTQGQRNDALARLAGSWVKCGLSHALAIAEMWNVLYCQPTLPSNELKNTVASIWRTEQRRVQAAQPFEGVIPL